jgi:hypothetical protein
MTDPDISATETSSTPISTPVVESDESGRTNSQSPTIERPRHWRWDWLIPIIFFPRRIFKQITSQTVSVWQVPIIIFLIAALLEVFAAGSVRQKATALGEFTPPPGFEYYSVEQQDQYRQVMGTTTSNAFIYGIPALLAITRVIAVWLLMGGLLHLIMTLLGGRGDTGSMMNVVAWAALPLAIRSFIRAMYIYFSGSIINSPGFSGLLSNTGSNWNLFLSAFLTTIDIFIIWHAVLLMIGVRQGTQLSIPKVIFGVVFTLLLILLIQALISFGLAKIGGLTIIRPYF